MKEAHSTGLLRKRNDQCDLRPRTHSFFRLKACPGYRNDSSLATLGITWIRPPDESVIYGRTRAHVLRNLLNFASKVRKPAPLVKDWWDRPHRSKVVPDMLAPLCRGMLRSALAIL